MLNKIILKAPIFQEIDCFFISHIIFYSRNDNIIIFTLTETLQYTR